MLAQLGNFVLWMALATSAYAFLSSILSGRTGRMDLTVSAERAVYATFALCLAAMGTLEYLFVTDSFNVHYVATHSSRDLSTPFKFTAMWSGMQGSLLLWAAILSGFNFFATLKTRHLRGPLASYATAIMSFTQVFFLVLIGVHENPFIELTFTPADGQGMNPLLVHPAMAIHPPMLYLGYVGFIVPYAFAMGSLLTRQANEEWILKTRRWTLFPWFFLGTGQLLGGKWAYVVLGWGGYWGWDPVENAALLPWLTGTAFLHSVMIQEKKGMLKVWNMALVILTFTLCIYGTFLTRSGVVSSVHAFAQSPIGPWFGALVVLIVVFSGILLYTRLGMLKSTTHYESPISREGGFLLNNVLFLTATFAVFWGVMFPIFSEAITGDKITVSAPYFNMVMVPIGLLLLLLTGVGPLLAWRKTSGQSLKRHFTYPASLGLLCAIVPAALGVRDVYALISFAFSGFVTGTIISEFHRGALARGSSSGESYIKAVINLTLRNKRRYGGYVVHFGIVLLFIGFTGNAFNQNIETELGYMESATIGPYTLTYEGVTEEVKPLTVDLTSQLAVYKHGERLGTMYPQQKVYYKREDQQRTTEVSIRSTLREDLYVLCQGFQMRDGKEVALFHVYVNPLVIWVWIGAWVITLGTIITMIPDPREKARHRRIVGMPKEREAVA
ncbi:MAG: heme lyase CcmF/NrfE family subunit [bacterium]|nr:heme lyase CcmF/NrfE family subunit [bacterium]